MKRGYLSFSNQLFLYVVSLYLLFFAVLLGYQHHREKVFREELLNTELQDFNHGLKKFLGDSCQVDLVEGFTHKFSLAKQRVTILDTMGVVVYDNYAGKQLQGLENHLLRPEIQEAMDKGVGYDVRRVSSITGEPFFYSASRFGHWIVRSAMPYNSNLYEHLEADQRFLWLAMALMLLLFLAFYRVTWRLGKTISSLRKFALLADKEEDIEHYMLANFPHGELEDISKHIMQIYERLHATKQALSIEREKLIAHLLTSQEGLGVFDVHKQEILVNTLFIQYANVIANETLTRADEVLKIPELKGLMEFIEHAIQVKVFHEDMRKQILVNKNAKTFLVKCILFQDFSFEVSINDVTQSEEQARMKRQLTQNIAHELKTPVSSIQGYLETIVNHEDLPKELMLKFLDRCYAQSNRLSRLIKDLSMLSKMEDNGRMMELDEVDLTQLLEGINGELALELGKRNMKVVINLPKVMYIKANHTLLYSIFRNLMDNAISYAGEGTEIFIECFREDDQFYYFSVADSGVGVEEEHLNRIFERFYRVDKGRSRKLGGTGLGLAIVKNAVSLHRGTISAKRGAKGGLELVFTLAKKFDHQS